MMPICRDWMQETEAPRVGLQNGHEHEFQSRIDDAAADTDVKNRTLQQHANT
jgi:hypothetical protein